MKVVTQKQMVEIDRKTIEDYLIPSSVLMENAGINLTKHILTDFPEILSKGLSILIGIGNNGGDGSVIARQLYNIGCIAKIFFIGNAEKLKSDALVNLNILFKLGFTINYISNENDWSKHKNEIFTSSFILDCLFGTGLSSPLSGIYYHIIMEINDQYRGIVISIDIPSGLILSETNITDEITPIKAHTTYTVGLPKLGMLDYPARNFTGKLRIVDIGFPKELLVDETLKYNLIDEKLASSLLPKRVSNSHKGNYGHLLIIGGSRKYSGAAVLSSKASFRTGCGLVTVASIDECCNSVRCQFPEVIFLPLTDNGEGIISRNNISTLLEYINRINTIVIGPGIGLHSDILDIIKSFITCYSGNLLIDADALNILSNNLDILKSSSAKIVFNSSY